MKKFLYNLFAYVSLLVLLSSYIINMSCIITSLVSNFYVLMFLVGLLSGSNILLTIYLTAKLGITNSLLFDFRGKTYYIRPWKLYMKIARQNFPRKVYGAGEMPKKLLEEIKNSKMDERHNHLNKYYDDTH
jgi:hypothetical protein